MLIPLALLFWFGWGLKFGIWWDIGLYSILVTMIGFGLIGGLIVYRKNK